ncbi:UDP-glycosyltransferase 73D1 [Zea mays]|uniref:UDP-glycosyltransferase 73D1 n=1 Tax=Zea mays TaxID=4577 RepID=A0A1D6H7J9_MAIZE|nr:UDP-glycosyltransferase 73D1 [Zea mays]
MPAPCSALRDREGDALPPSCIVSDACHPWTGGVARELGVSCFLFDGFCAFSSLCMCQMNLHRIFEGVVDDDTRPARVPAFPIDLVEIGHGLEATKRPFIWVVKPRNLAEFEWWLSEDGFESRVGETGLVIRDWAPQKVILLNPAMGAFVTHCGWNSVLECVAAGLPMVSCPHFAEQFMNEKLVVDVLRVGIKGAAQWGMEAEGVLATRQDVERAVAAVMDCGEEGSARRARAAELGRKAQEAVVHGGSSFRNVALLIQHVQQRASTRNPWIEKKPSDRR